MALIKPDFSEVSAQFTDGEYKVRVEGAEVGEYKTGTKYVAWKLATFGEEQQKDEGRKLTYKTPITGRGAFMTQKFWQVCTGEAVDGEFDTEQLLGRECSIIVALNDNGYPDVKSVKPLI